MLFNRYKKLSQLKKNVLSGSVLAGASILLLLAAYPVYLKYLGAEQYGLWATLSVVVFFSQLGELGINNALIKYVAGEFGKKNFKGITEYTTTSLYILIIPFSLIILVLFLFTTQITGFLDLKSSYISEAERLIPLMGLLSVFIMFVELAKGVLMGVGRVDIANYTFLLGRIIQVAASVILIIGGFGIWGLFWGTVFSYIVTFIVYLYILCVRYKIKIFRIDGFAKSCLHNLLSFGGTMFSTKVTKILVQPFNKVIIAKYVGLPSVTYYELALKGALSLRGLYEMGLKAIMPKVSELQQKAMEINHAIKSIHRQSIKFIFFFGLPAFCILFALAKFVLSIWLGESYNPQISMALRWFLFGYIINLFAVPSYFIFMGLNKVHLCFYAALLSSFGHSGVILFFIFAGFSVSLNLIVAVNAFAIIGEALFMIMYYLKIDKYCCSTSLNLCKKGSKTNTRNI